MSKRNIIFIHLKIMINKFNKYMSHNNNNGLNDQELLRLI